MQSRSQLLNSNQTWDPKRRYKINAVVGYSGGMYQNTTGGNSDPLNGSDWMVLSNAASLPAGVEFTAIGGETSFDMIYSGVAKLMFFNGVPQSKTMWNQSGSIINLNFTNPLSAGDFIQMI